MDELRQRFERTGIVQLLGFKLEHIAAGEADVSMQTLASHMNPMGTVHGGIFCAIADAAMGFAYASTLEAGQSFATLELKINYFKPIKLATLTARGRIVKRGRKVGMVECNITDETGSLVARVSSTCMTLSGDETTGRGFDGGL